MLIGRNAIKWQQNTEYKNEIFKLWNIDIVYTRNWDDMYWYVCNM